MKAKVNNHIALVDCNNFFVSCERLFRPDLSTQPVIVLSSNDGCVISRSEEAKTLGFKMGEPYFRVRDRCVAHRVTVFSSNFALYRDLSRRVMSVLRRYSDELEVYSVDEAFLVLTGDNVREQACAVREAVFRETGIPVAVGVSHTKTLAKVAAHYAKPKHGDLGAKVLVRDGDIQVALADLPIRDVWGIGFRLAPTLVRAGVTSAVKLICKDSTWIRARMGVRGLRVVQELQGTRCFEVGADTSLRKSLLHSQSFGNAVVSFVDLRAAVAFHARKVAETLRAEDTLAREVVVLVRTSRYRKEPYAACKGEVLAVHTSDTIELVSAATSILARIYRSGVSYAKAGVMVRDIIPAGGMPEHTLFGARSEPQSVLMQAIDDLRHRHHIAPHMTSTPLTDRHGQVQNDHSDLMCTGAELVVKRRHEHPWHARHNRLSPQYTTHWEDLVYIRT